MTVLFFDTETTGFNKSHLPLDHPDQPHIVQIAAQLCQDDGEIMGEFSYIVNPGISIPQVVTDIHGIDDEKARVFGIIPATMLSIFCQFYNMADKICAHNVKFDKAILEIALTRHFKREMLLEAPTFCTMNEAQPVVDLPPTEKMVAAGRMGPKPPKLEECVWYFFNEKLEGAHDAMVDVVACRRVYFALQEITQ